jgi:hypothetical protein
VLPTNNCTDIDAGTTTLSEYSGGGKQAAYAYYKPKPNLALHVLRQALAEKLEMSMEQVEETRFVVLMAGRDGENFLHQDQSDHPCQAVVMLSDPCVDYSGGATYIQDANNVCGTREEVCMNVTVSSSLLLQPLVHVTSHSTFNQFDFTFNIQSTAFCR